ncbi:MAG TPA: MFS transporter [Methanofollis liminatans]|uniref:MFS transporter n=1 Tax=Methanofollis liminatans TaxID=2201 RepID=A0A831PNY4_9EURY|nr:MFS transporter [Methanofollis liminatans]
MVPRPFKPTKWTLLFLLLAAMMILMGGAAVAPALPLISEAFPDAPDSLVSLIVTLPSLAIALTGIFIGALSDKIGKIRVLVASIVIFTIAGSSGYYLTSLYAILAGRILLGVGIAGITCATSSLIPCYYEGQTRARVLGYQAAAMGLGVLILEMSGGLLAGISWHAAFLIYLIGIVILAGVLLTMKEPVLPKIERNKALSEEQFPVAPLLLGYVTLFLGSMLFFLMPIKFPYLIANMEAARILGENTALTSGLFLGIMGCAASLIGLFYGRLAWRFNRYTILTLTFIFFGIGYCSLGLATSLAVVAFAVICIGLGNGVLMPTVLTWIATITPKQFLGRASGGFSVALNIGQFASTLAIVPVAAVAVTYGNMFLAFGCAAFVLALPYLVATIRAKYALPQMVSSGTTAFD